MKKLILILLSIVMVLSVFTACGGNEPAATTPADTTAAVTPSDTTESVGVDTTTEPDAPVTTKPTEPSDPTKEDGFETPETIKINLVDGNINYTIIRPDKSSSASPEVKRAAYLVSSFTDLLGVAPSINTDWKRNNDSEALEIVVGLTDYDETAAVLDDIKYGEYIIKAVGNKIVIMGYTPKALETATKKFYDICRANCNKSAKEITLTPETLYCKESSNAALNELPTYYGDGITALYYDSGLRTTGSSCDMIAIQGVAAEGFAAYTAKFEAEGYTCYVSTDMGKNKFATYTKDSSTVTVGYFPADRTIRVTLEKNAPAAGLESENKFTKITSSQLSMLGQEVKDNNGLSQLIRLEDGRFIVIDGGHKGANYAAEFIEEIKKQAASYTDKPVIAAWILTHAHSDHDALFYQHAVEMKNKGITVERVFMNALASQAELDRIHALGVSTDSIGMHGSINLCINAANNIGATMHKVHTGQVFYFANAKIEVLYTHETLFPSVVNQTNTTSLVMKFTFTDSATGKVTTFLSTGDATCNAFKNLNSNFKDYINCDILSLAHHGGSVGAGGAYAEKSTYTINAYKAVAPSLALWPFGPKVDRAYNSQKDVGDALFALSTTKEVYIAGNLGDTTIVPLPYTVGNVEGHYIWNIANARVESVK